MKCNNCDYPYATLEKCPNCGEYDPTGKIYEMEQKKLDESRIVNEAQLLLLLIEDQIEVYKSKNYIRYLIIIIILIYISVFNYVGFMDGL